MVALIPARIVAHIVCRSSAIVALLLSLGLCLAGMSWVADSYKSTGDWYYNFMAQVMVAGGYCTLGYLAQSHIRSDIFSRPVLLAAVLYGCLLVWGATTQVMAWSTYPDGAVHHLVSGLLGSASVVLIAKSMPDAKAMRTVGRYSRAVMSYHLPVFAVINVVLVLVGSVEAPKVHKYFAFDRSHLWPIYVAAGVLLPVAGALLIERVRFGRERQMARA